MIKKRRIAFLIYSLSSGGAERVVTTLANNLIQYYDVTVITFVNLPPFYELDKRVKLIPCFSKITHSANQWKAIKNNYNTIKRIKIILKDNNIELLIAFMTTANVLAAIIGIMTKIPVIISERNNPVKQKLSRFWKILRKVFYPYSDYLVVQTPIIKNYFINIMNESRIRELPNPISSQLSSLRNTNFVKENIILNVGSLTDQKAQQLLIQAFAKVLNLRWKLIIVGEGPKRKDLELLIEQLNLTENVLLAGQQKDIHNYYNRAKIFAFSSTFEGFPNALIEAMHFGLACISTDCPTGPSELIQDGKNGYLVPINDLKEMSLKLNVLMENHSIIEEFGLNAAQSVQSFEEDKVIIKWHKMIKSILISSKKYDSVDK